jgi:predicted negative regulator of RcsB-dependent stress response
MLPANKNIQLHLEGLAVNAPLNMGVIWLIAAILLMALLVFVTWFLLRAKRHRSATQSQKGYEKATPKNAKKDTNQEASKKKEKTSEKADRKQELLEELVALDQEYEAGKLDEAVYQERRNKTKASLRSLMEI